MGANGHKEKTMHLSYDAHSPKKPTNLSINSDLLQQAKELKINLSQPLEERLVEVIRETRRRQWLAENPAALDEYNQRIESGGVFSDNLWSF